MPRLLLVESHSSSAGRNGGIGGSAEMAQGVGGGNSQSGGLPLALIGSSGSRGFFSRGGAGRQAGSAATRIAASAGAPTIGFEDAMTLLAVYFSAIVHDYDHRYKPYWIMQNFLK